jgi:hypothetical protein
VENEPGAVTLHDLASTRTVRGLPGDAEVAVTELEPVTDADSDEESEPHIAALVPSPDDSFVLVILENGVNASLPQLGAGGGRETTTFKGRKHTPDSHCPQAGAKEH